MNALSQHSTARNARILIVEDEPAHAEAIRRAFEQAGWSNVDFVDTLRAYRERCATALPDIALLDLILPDGRSTELLTSPADAGAFPVVVMTSHGDERTVVEVLRAGAFDYLVKTPESFLELPRTLTRIQREWSLMRDRKQAMDALRTSEARYRAITENSPNGIFLADLDGAVQYVNPTIVEQFGAPATRLLGTGWQEFVHPADFERVGNAWADYLAGRLPRFDTECRMLRGDGSEHYLQVSAVAIRENGHVVSHVGSTRDVTERNSLQKQLIQAQKMEAVGQLTGGIAHDFNNILASMLGYTDLALELYVPDKASKLATYLTEVMKAGERARNLIGKMLAFSRGAEGEAQPVAAGQMITEVVQLLHSAFPASIKLTTDISPTVPLILIDPVQLHQILMNLCINARDAISTHGRIEIKLSRRAEVEAICASCHLPVHGEFVEIRVSDNGSGIDPHTLSHMFEPFFTTKEIGKGSGMGLSTVHGLVHGAGGHLFAESQPGAGSTLRIWLPAASASSIATAHSATIESKAVAPEANKLIMVVDDEPSVGALVGELLRSQGYAANVFEDSQVALTEFRTNPTRYAAMLTDFTMPGLNGIELTRAVLAQRPGFPVILCTGYTEHTSALENEPGVRAFFIKPVRPMQLLSALHALFAGEFNH